VCEPSKSHEGQRERNQGREDQENVDHGPGASQAQQT
jgi:hypothetical protein